MALTNAERQARWRLRRRAERRAEPWARIDVDAARADLAALADVGSVGTLEREAMKVVRDAKAVLLRTTVRAGQLLALQKGPKSREERERIKIASLTDADVAAAAALGCDLEAALRLARMTPEVRSKVLARMKG